MVKILRGSELLLLRQSPDEQVHASFVSGTRLPKVIHQVRVERELRLASRITWLSLTYTSELYQSWKTTELPSTYALLRETWLNT